MIIFGLTDLTCTMVFYYSNLETVLHFFALKLQRGLKESDVHNDEHASVCIERMLIFPKIQN